MKHRKLRIAWSVAWGIVAALLIALWARSYWSKDSFVLFRRVASTGLYSCRGGIEIVRDAAVQFGDGEILWSTESCAVDERHDNASTPTSSFGWRGDWSHLNVFAPDWLFVLISATLAVAPWVRWRFSLRTLLIATTLVAVGLGLIVRLR